MLYLEGSCRCRAVVFTCDSHAPVPYQLCYCSICRKTAGGGGYAINLSAVASSLRIEGRVAVGVYRAKIDDADGHCTTSTGQRSSCMRCAAALWLYDPEWPELLHPFASAIDTELPPAPARTHIMLDFKPAWVPLGASPQDILRPGGPDESIEEWHRRHGFWRD